MSDAEVNIVILLMLGLSVWIGRLKWVNRKLNKQLAALPAPPPPRAATTPEGNGEVTRLRERVAVLERITVEKEDTLSRQIDSLRDR